MLIRSKRGWEIPESQATPEHAYLSRRALITGAGAVAAGTLFADGAQAQRIGDLPDPSLALYPAKRNERYTIERPLTEESVSGAYNNFYEFGTHKKIYSAAQALKTRPWTITIDGLVEKPLTLGIDDLLKQVQLEERLYRHRCVEAWSMTVPWTGFPMKALLDIAKPLGSAKYVAMQTFLDPEMAPGQKARWYPWPYVEALTIAEAANELTFMVTGVYGKPAPKQFGAPLRVAIPWKYGFKSGKSLVRFSFTETQPKTFWQSLQGEEYGFWANVNPKVPHRRWSQADEEVIGTGQRRPTVLFNGYSEFVAGLYTGIDDKILWT